MKLRTILFASALVAATGASALTTTNTFARMPVTATLQNTLLAIPLAGCGESSPEIYVTNLVMTTGLAANTKLLYKDGSTWYAWTLTGGQWQKMAESTQWGTHITPAAGSTALPCGRGCWLVFPEAASTTVYLYGQVNEGAVSTTIAAGTPANPVYTILSYPYETGSINLSSWTPVDSSSASIPVAGDTVTVADTTSSTGQRTYTWGTYTSPTAGTGWYSLETIAGAGLNPPTVTKTKVSEDVEIQAGQAFIYGRVDVGKSINWARP